MKTLNFTREIPEDLYNVFSKLATVSDMSLEDYLWIQLLAGVEPDIEQMLGFATAKTKLCELIVRGNINAFWAMRGEVGVIIQP